MLVDFIGAVDDIRVEVVRHVILQDVANVGDQDIFLVPLLQVLKKAAKKK